MKGLALHSPKDNAVRPTSDRTREALFNLLAHRFTRSDGLPAYMGARLLDLCAGTGALSIEALSRGAKSAVLVENNSVVCELIRKNLAKAQVTHETRVLFCDAREVDLSENSFDLIFLDPPYNSEIIQDAVENILACRAMTPESLLCVESGMTEAITVSPDLKLCERRRYGRALLSVFQLLP